MSESGSVKSARSRSRTLPFLPPEDPVPLPTQAKKAQDRINSNRRAYATYRQSSLDGLTAKPFGTLSRPRPSNSETNLRKLALEDRHRPVSALGLLQASSVISSHGPSQAAKEHEKRILENILPPDLRHLIRGGSAQSIQSIRQQIESELKATNPGISDGEIARLNAEKRLFGAQTDRIRAEMQRYATMKDPRLRAEMKHKLNPVLDAQLNRNRKVRGHRRNFSDGRITSSLTDNMADESGYVGLPVRSFSSLSGGYLDSYDLGTDNSQSYLLENSILRDTNLSGFETDDDRRLLANRSRLLQRRSSAGGLEHLLGGGGYRNTTTAGGLDFGVDAADPLNPFGRRPHSSMSGKLGSSGAGGARSWHPSPFHSDDDNSAEEHQFFKEEKKNRIKMEISRRRQQIEENARLHEELIRLAKLRETAELGGSVVGPPPHHHSGDPHHRLGGSSGGMLGYPSPSLSPGMRDHHHHQSGGVLRSVDEILRNDYHSFGGGGGPTMMAGRNGTAGGRRDYLGMRSRHSLDEDMLGTSFNTDRYTSSVYDRVTDFSPVNSDFSDFPQMSGGRAYPPSSKYSAAATAAGRSNFYR